MFRVPLFIAIVLIVAFGGGIVSSIEALKATVGFGSISLGPWVAFPDAQTAAADPYAKAHRARTGRLLLGAAEGLRFTAEKDDTGAKLNAGCAYDIVGTTPPARFWTLFAADQAGAALDPGPERASAFNAWTVLRRTDSSFVIHVSPQAQPDNWLAVDPGVRFTLVLTLLDTPTAGSSGVIDLTMPKIVRTGCSHA